MPTIDEAIQVNWYGQILSIRDIDSAIGYILSFECTTQNLDTKRRRVFLWCVYARILSALGGLFKGQGPKDCEPLKAFLGSSLRGKLPEKKTKIQQFRYQQFVEGFSLQPIGIVHCNSFEGGSHSMDIVWKNIHSACSPQRGVSELTIYQLSAF